LTAYGILAWRRLTGVANDRGRLTEWGLDQGGAFDLDSVRIDPLCFLAGCRTRRINQALTTLLSHSLVGVIKHAVCCIVRQLDMDISELECYFVVLAAVNNKYIHCLYKVIELSCK